MIFQWYCIPLYKQRIKFGVLLIHIYLNVIQFETNGFKIVVENKLQLLKIYMNG